MEGDVVSITPRPTDSTLPNTSPEHLRKEQEKWDAWASNEGVSPTEAKRRYIEKLIETMRLYASHTEEARQLVEELEFVWDQVRNNSLHGSSEHSSPQAVERSAYIRNSSEAGRGGITSSAAAMEAGRPLRVLSPVSQGEEEAEMGEDEGEEFVDAPISQVDNNDFAHAPSEGAGEREPIDPRTAVQRAGTAAQSRRTQPAASAQWRKRVESSLFKLSTEIAALREQLETNRFIKSQKRKSFFGWVARLSWWAAQLFVADGVILWLVILYLRRKQDRRLEGAIRVLLGDAVAQVQKVAGDVKMPKLPQMQMPQMGGKKKGG
jgi:hypothetical protein